MILSFKLVGQFHLLRDASTTAALPIVKGQILPYLTDTNEALREAAFDCCHATLLRGLSECPTDALLGDILFFLVRSVVSDSSFTLRMHILRSEHAAAQSLVAS